MVRRPIRVIATRDLIQFGIAQNDESSVTRSSCFGCEWTLVLFDELLWGDRAHVRDLTHLHGRSWQSSVGNGQSKPARASRAILARLNAGITGRNHLGLKVVATTTTAPNREGQHSGVPALRESSKLRKAERSRF
jgi:hypothetical protein